MTQVPGQPTRVLVVDDQPIFAEALHALLDADPRVTVIGVATTADRAAELVAAEAVDVALVDYVMPLVDGFELTRRLQELRPGLRVLVVSGRSDSELPRRAAEAGASGFLLKGGLGDDVVTAVLDARGTD